MTEITIRERYTAAVRFLNGPPAASHPPPFQGWEFVGILLELVEELIRTRRPYPCIGWDEAVSRARELVG